MNIKLDCSFGISSDENNFTLFEVKTKGKDAKDAGAEYQSTVGYYGTLKGALKGYFKMSTRKNTDNIKTIEELYKKILAIEENINKAL